MRRDTVPGGTCVTVNWLGECDLPANGERAASIFHEVLAWPGETHRTTCYRMDVTEAPGIATKATFPSGRR